MVNLFEFMGILFIPWEYIRKDLFEIMLPD